MYKRLVILAVAVVVALTAAVPASAATWIQLRINPSSANWTGSTFADIPMSWTTTMWGGTLLWTPPGRPWGQHAVLLRPLVRVLAADRLRVGVRRRLPAALERKLVHRRVGHLGAGSAVHVRDRRARDIPGNGA